MIHNKQISDVLAVQLAFWGCNGDLDKQRIRVLLLGDDACFPALSVFERQTWLASLYATFNILNTDEDTRRALISVLKND
jgi:hypothetical protein